MLRAEVDRGRCQGASECTHLAPKSFRIDETVTSVAIDPPGDADADVLEAARGCPNQAIRVLRDEIVIDVWASGEANHG